MFLELINRIAEIGQISVWGAVVSFWLVNIALFSYDGNRILECVCSNLCRVVSF